MFETRPFDIGDAMDLVPDASGRARVEEIAACVHMGTTVIETASGRVAGFGVLFFMASSWWVAAWLSPALRRRPLTAFRLASRGLAAAGAAGIGRIQAVLDVSEPRAGPWAASLGFRLDPAGAATPPAERIWVWQTP